MYQCVQKHCVLIAHDVLIVQTLPHADRMEPELVMLTSDGLLVCGMLSLCRRQEPIIAIGGGVCLDVAGLAANLYRRNTGIIKVTYRL